MINRAPPRVHTRAGGLVLALMLASCVSTPAPPPQVPAPAPIARAMPVPLPAPVARQPEDWRDRALTPGDWRYASGTDGTIARYGDGLFAIACAPARRTVTLSMRLDGDANATALPATLITTVKPHPYSANITGGRLLTVALPAMDATLDEMAFSRGRFAFEASGQPTLILPAWEEVGRVIEDCR